MASNKQLELALEIATLAHKGVERRDGDPYIFHSLRVANNKTYIRTKLQKAVAILHDVIEDTPFTRSFLAQKGINKSVLDVLDYLTHDEAKVSYEAYIEHICTNIDAMLVKLSDLHDNLDETTIPNITERDRETTYPIDAQGYAFRISVSQNNEPKTTVFHNIRLTKTIYGTTDEPITRNRLCHELKLFVRKYNLVTNDPPTVKIIP